MGRVKQLADVNKDNRLKYINCPELHIDEVIINVEKVEPKMIENIWDCHEMFLDLRNSKLLFAESVTKGIGEEEVKGIILYLQLTNREQVAVEVYASDTKEDDLRIAYYM